MKAFVIHKYGAAGQLADVPEPTMGDLDVLVEVRAASVNPLDLKIQSGEFKRVLTYRLPLTLGNDGAGVVLRVGKRVTRFKPGDEVYMKPDQSRIGTFAERIAVSEDDLARKPENLTMAQAASLPLVALTAWQALVETAALGAGQKVLIHAGSGGVGSVAIPLAKHLGAYVATTTSERNLAWVKELGADLVIDYKNRDFSAELRDYDVVLHSLGQDVLFRSAGVLGRGGQLLSLSGPPTPEFAKAQGLSWPIQGLLALASYKVRKTMSARGGRYAFIFMRASGAQLEKITALVESGVIRPAVEREFSLADAGQALAYVKAGHARGKVVVTISS